MSKYVVELKQGEPVTTWYWECSKCGHWTAPDTNDYEVECEAKKHAEICGTEYIEE